MSNRERKKRIFPDGFFGRNRNTGRMYLAYLFYQQIDVQQRNDVCLAENFCNRSKVAEEEGFEPSGAVAPAVFKTAALNHSTTPP